MGFVEGYDEIERLNTAFLEADGMQQDFSGSFLQTVWDNADKNVRTLTRFDTFHTFQWDSRFNSKERTNRKNIKKKFC